MRPVQLDGRLQFPDPRKFAAGWFTETPVAMGGDFSIERLMLAYRNGIFPWTAQPIGWWSPDPRGVIFPREFHVARSLARTLRQKPYTVTVDRAFDQVVAGCASASRPGRWITPEFIEAYGRLHRAGHAHSVECWRGGAVVGGIYGVAVGGIFCGESMFHTTDNASKIALASLMDLLVAKRFALLDTQMVTETTLQFGATEIPRSEYLTILDAVKDHQPVW